MTPTLVFDLGAVVLRWQPVRLLMDHLPHRLPDEASAARLAAVFFESFRPGSDWAEFDRGVLEVPEVARRIAHRLALPEEDVLAVMQGIPDHLQVRSDTADLLGQLHAAGHRLVYLSNMPKPYCDPVQAKIDALGVFETGLYSSAVGLVKPEPAIYQEALRKFRAEAGDCILFDDIAVNVAAARREGWQSLQFSDAAAAKVQLAALGLLRPDAMSAPFVPPDQPA